ncbi:MAG: glycoside hydrolase family 38 C-terminal domain-containing protein [Armatimonadota bacterium]
MDYKGLDQIVKSIRDKHEAFVQVGALRKWSHKIVDGFDEPCDALFAGEHEVVDCGFTWSSARGDAWFWKEITLPEEAYGVSLAGSPADFIFIFPIGSTIFLNGKRIYHEPFWSDTRAIELKVLDSCKPGEKLQFAIKAKSGDGFGAFLDTFLRIESLDKVGCELDVFAEQLDICKYLTQSAPTPEKESLLQKAAGAIDLDALESNDWARWRECAKNVVEILMPFDTEAKKFEINLIAHSHIDMNWLWPWNETVDLCKRDFSSMDSLMSRYDGFVFSQSQAAVYKAMQDYHPDVFERIKERVAQGKWEVTASTWVEGDLNMAMGETLVRQILHSKRYLRENFNIEPKVCWEPDTFGHPVTYPQILKKSGIDYYYFCRSGKGYPVFMWQSPDGSQVQAYNDLGYGGDVCPWVVGELGKRVYEQTGLKTGIKVYGTGDHGGAATARDIERGIELGKTPFYPKTRMSSFVNFQKKIKASGVELPVVEDELNTIFEGCYSSHGDIKWLNRYGETSLLTAETLAALASIDAGFDYPTQTLADAWKNQSFHQFHDILCGCAIGSTYRDAAKALKPSQDAFKSIISDSASKFAGKVDTGSGEPKIVVINQLAWERTDIAEVDVKSIGKDPANVSVKDESGNLFPAQVLDGKLVFVAKDVPSLGCKVYSIVNENADTDIKVDEAELTIENDLIKISVNPNSGAVSSLLLKKDNIEFAQPGQGWGPEGKVNAGMLNRFMIYFEQPHPMSAWNIGDITKVESLISGAEVKLIESGPAVAVIEVKHKFLNSGLTQQIRVYAGMERIDFVTEVDWHEKGGATHDAPMLKTTFTPYFGDSKATYEVPFGAVERTANGQEVPALRWADLSDSKAGITLANNCKYGHSAQGNTLALTLVRASYEPDNNPDEGLHHFTYSIFPHMGSWKESNAVSGASQLNQPLVSVIEAAHSGALKPGEGMLSLNSDSVVVSAVKLAEDQPGEGAAVIVRLFESNGEPAKAVLSTKWSVIKAEETNMLEEQGKALQVGGNSIALDFGKSEIKTVKLYVKK